MPTHGIRLDLEFLAIVVLGAAVSYFLTDRVVSNVFFTALIASLFFLIGLHMELDKLKKCVHHKKTLAIGLLLVYVMTPLTAYLFSLALTGALAEAMIVIGVSAAALGSPVVFSNMSKAEGEIALIVAGVSLILGIAAIPLLLHILGSPVSVTDLAVNNLLFLGAPLLLGMFSQRFENQVFDDMRHHFSKLGLWLLVLVMAVQFKLLYASQGLAFLGKIAAAVPVLAGFTAFTFILGHAVPVKLGVMERKARSLAFVTGSKSLAVALFLASQVSGEVVAYVTVYYFVRQAVTGAIAEYFRHGELRLSRLEKLAARWA